MPWFGKGFNDGEDAEEDRKVEEFRRLQKKAKEKEEQENDDDFSMTSHWCE